MSNRPFTSETDIAIMYGLSQFIAWQDAVATAIVNGSISQDAALAIVTQAGASVTELMIGNSISPGNNEISLNNKNGCLFASFVEKDLEMITKALETKIANMEKSHAAI